MTEIHMIRFPSLFIALCLAVAFAQSPVFGQGAQTLQFVTSSYPVVYFPTGVVTGNFNSDSFLDIAAVANGDRVSVFLGNGNGGFQNHIDFPTGDTFSFSLATGDFLNRGVTDIVTANESVCGVSFLKGNGNGTFQAPITSSLGAPSFCPVALAAGNFYPNLTGNQPQLAVLYDQQLGTTGAFAIMLLDISSGTFFSNFPRIPTTDAQPGGMAVADLNGDGKPDVIVANTKSNSVSIFLLNSNGTFAPKVDYPTTTGPFSVIAVDLENRGILDLVVVNSFGNV